MSVMLSHPSSCLLFLFLLLSGHFSAAGTSIPDMMKNRAARLLNRARKAKQSRAFLHAHNIARVTSGMPPLEWNKGLARFAHNWAKQRKPDCNMTHSGGPYGENIFWYRQRKMWSPQKVVTRWFEERFNYDRKTNTCTSDQMCGHYTQIVWRSTTAVGCARMKCDNNRGYLVVCEYDPCGNYEGESPFDQTQQLKNVTD
ncbi:Pathogenesis-related protein 1 [Cardamine amara subsp. amara]|uniref:Pathogenesis-related protein 1 n=1 Tax=Cardamine amara subsp. amara TaxID=228776 RepID=A0ABD0ZTI3_CARAN